MKKANLLFISLCLSFIAGCASTVYEKEALYSKKEITYPKIDAQEVASEGQQTFFYSGYYGNISYIGMDQSVALQTGFLWKEALLPNRQEFIKSKVGDKEAICSKNKLVKEITGLAVSPVCLTKNNASDDHYDSYHYKPGSVWFSKPMPVKYTVVPSEQKFSGDSPLEISHSIDSILDKEILIKVSKLYDSGNKGQIIKALIPNSLPAIVTVDSVVYEFINVEDNKIGYKIKSFSAPVININQKVQCLTPWGSQLLLDLDGCLRLEGSTPMPIR